MIKETDLQILAPLVEERTRTLLTFLTLADKLGVSYLKNQGSYRPRVSSSSDGIALFPDEPIVSL